jgi:hypothetical protein
VSESFRIGPYEITEVDRDWEISGGGSILGVSQKHVAGGYSYLFRGSNGERRGKCVIGADERGFPPGGPVSVRHAMGRLGCVCRGSNLTVQLSYTPGLGARGRGQWVLGDGENYRGKLQAGGRYFSVKIISSTEGKGRTYVEGEGWKDTVVVPSLEPTGALVYGGGPAAGLELLHPGRAWFARSLKSSQREEIACLFGGLLLYESPSERPD